MMLLQNVFSKQEILFSRLRYYFESVFTLIFGVKTWPTVMALLLHLPIKRPCTVMLRKSRLRFKVRTFMDVWVIKETCLNDDYHSAGLELDDGGVIIDIGAGLGDYSIAVARRYAKAMVYAYEPFPESFALLMENTKLNQIQNIRPSPYAISGTKGSHLTLYAPSSHATMNSTIPIADTLAVDGTVPSLTLDQIFENLDLSICNLLKVDCEGAEFDIFFGASDDTLRKIKRISLEYHDGITPHSHQDLMQFLQQKGFDVQHSPNKVHRELGFLYAQR